MEAITRRTGRRRHLMASRAFRDTVEGAERARRLFDLTQLPVSEVTLPLPERAPLPVIRNPIVETNKNSMR